VRETCRGEAETPRARRRLLARGGDSSCEAKTSRARRGLVGEATYSSETSRLASDGLDKDL
jgi:hypothetical protein